MSLKLFTLIEHDDLIIGGSLSGDLILWTTSSIFDAVEKRLNDQQQLDKLMSNPEEENSVFSKIEEVAEEVQVESLAALRHFKNPLHQLSGIHKRVSINKIKAYKNYLAIAYTDGIAILDIQSLAQGVIKIIYDSAVRKNGSQAISTQDLETNDLLFITLNKIDYLVSSNADNFVRLLNINSSSTVCEINLTSPCLCLTLIDNEVIAVGTQSSEIFILSIKQDGQDQMTFIGENLLDYDMNQDKENYGIHHLSYDPQTFSLYSAVSQIGVFKWFYAGTLGDRTSEPSLIKIFPITQGNNVFSFFIKQQASTLSSEPVLSLSRSFSQQQSQQQEPSCKSNRSQKKLLIAQSSEFLIKYDLQAGFAGYYQSPNFSQVFDILDLDSALHQDRLLLIVGSPKSTSSDSLDITPSIGGGGDQVYEEVMELQGEKDKCALTCCVEVINEESNSLVLRLTA